MMKSGIQFVSFKACFVLPASGRVDAGDGQDGRPGWFRYRRIVPLKGGVEP